MSLQEMRIANKKVEMDQRGSKSKLRISGRNIEVTYDKDVHSYGAEELPYTTFSDLKALARALIVQKNN